MKISEFCFYLIVFWSFWIAFSLIISIFPDFVYFMQVTPEQIKNLVN